MYIILCLGGDDVLNNDSQSEVDVKALENKEAYYQQVLA